MNKLNIKLIILFLFAFIIHQAAIADIGPGLGQQAPGFRLADMKKEPVTLRDLRKKGHVLLIFWSTKCHVCHAMLPQFKKVYKDYKNKGLTVAAVNIGYENHEQVADYILQHDLPYLVLNKDNQKSYLAQAYQLVGTPTIKLVDPSGKILYHGHTLPDLKKFLKKS